MKAETIGLLCLIAGFILALFGLKRPSKLTKEEKKEAKDIHNRTEEAKKTVEEIKDVIAEEKKEVTEDKKDAAKDKVALQNRQQRFSDILKDMAKFQVILFLVISMVVCSGVIVAANDPTIPQDYPALKAAYIELWGITNKLKDLYQESDSHVKKLIADKEQLISDKELLISELEASNKLNATVIQDNTRLYELLNKATKQGLEPQLAFGVSGGVNKDWGSDDSFGTELKLYTEVRFNF
jgi:ABC-type transport system involved in cytochrome bd biosynthesis fused ATPase/permease subunit